MFKHPTGASRFLVVSTVVFLVGLGVVTGSIGTAQASNHCFPWDHCFQYHPTHTPTPSVSVSVSVSPTASPSSSPVATDTPTPSVSATPSSTPTPSATPSDTPTPAPTPTPLPQDTQLPCPILVVTPTPDASNLVVNGDLEIQNCPNPANWSAGSWGTNDATFTYPVAGETGVGANVTITNYTDGDAKWFFDDVLVVPGHTYTFSDAFKSTAFSDIVARYTLASGDFQYAYFGGVASSSVWNHFSHVFDAISDAVSLTVFHLIQVPGSLTVDNASIINGTPTPTPSATPTPVATATPTPAPTDAPTIFGEQAINVTDTSITITWFTSHPATSRVVYDIASHSDGLASPSYGYAFTTEEDSSLVASHSVTVNGLTPATVYYFRGVSHGSPEAASHQVTQATTSASLTSPSGGGSGGSSGGSGGGGGGGAQAVFSVVSPTPVVVAVAGASTTNGGTDQQVLGASTTLPDTGASTSDRIYLAIFAGFIAAGLALTIRGAVGYMRA